VLEVVSPGKPDSNDLCCQRGAKPQRRCDLTKELFAERQVAPNQERVEQRTPAPGNRGKVRGALLVLEMQPKARVGVLIRQYSDLRWNTSTS
jgi:hypothetical protein